MNRLNFSIQIHAPKEKVWKTLLEDETYRQWTSGFCEGSYAETDWSEGGSARFLDKDGNGMMSQITVHRPNDYLEIKHLSFIMKDPEAMEGVDEEEWSGALEIYRVEEHEGTTTLVVESDIDDKCKEMFEETWPKALQKVKELSEK